MDSLRIDNGLKKIEVNDAGEYIEFSVLDNDFFRGFSELMQWFDGQNTKDNINNMNEQAGKVVSENGDEINHEALSNIIDIRDKVSKEACEKIDNIFGVGASKKIFGGIVPDMFSIAEFFEKIAPFIEKYAKERNQSINKKYSKSRKGAKS